MICLEESDIPKRNTKKTPLKDTTIRKGRTYEDFEKYLLDNPDTSVVEMDTVQKGAIEKNHDFIRYVIPKGTSMANLTQNDITKLINHINSLTRPSLNNSTPYDLAQILLNKNVLKKLNLEKVAANEIQLKPSLLKKN